MCPNVCLTHNVGSDALIASIDAAELPRPPEETVVLMEPGPSGIANDELPRPPDRTCVSEEGPAEVRGQKAGSKVSDKLVLGPNLTKGHKACQGTQAMGRMP